MIEAFRRTLLENQIISAKEFPKPDLEAMLAEWKVRKDSYVLSQQVARLYHLPWVDISNTDVKALVSELNLSPLLLRHQCLPIALEGQSLTLASAHPLTAQMEKELHLASGYAIHIAIADYQAICAALALLTHPHTDRQVQDESLPSLLEDIFHQAYKQQASDIHIEAYQSQYRVRLRCDGLLQALHHISKQQYQRLLIAIKIMAKMDIAEKRRPQDGHIDIPHPASPLKMEARVSTLPTLYGEKAVIRMVESIDMTLSLHELGMSSQQISLFTAALEKAQGMILITGPTGSGKTRSLYAALKHINTIEHNIATVEDPVEHSIEGINQVQVDTGIDLTFSHTLRALLRQDPDIIMIGEIRDTDTASIAVRAAQTGHLILSTLHTKSAVEAMIRLSNLGVEPYNIASALTLILAQRLIRKLCPLCKEPIKSDNGLGAEPITYQAKPGGCPHCNNGYKGRIGIFELLPVTSKLTEAISLGTNLSQLKKLAQQIGMSSLAMSGKKKVMQGIISEAELIKTIELLEP